MVLWIGFKIGVKWVTRRMVTQVADVAALGRIWPEGEIGLGVF